MSTLHAQTGTDKGSPTPSPSSPPMVGVPPLDDRGELVPGQPSPQNDAAGIRQPVDIRQVQQQLVRRGFPLTIDGNFGPQTQAALQSFQQSQGFSPTGRLNQQTLSALGIGVQGSGNVGAESTTTTGVRNDTNPSAGSNPSSNPPGVGSNPGSGANPSGVGANPSSIGNPAGVGSGSSSTPSSGTSPSTQRGAEGAPRR